MSTDTVLFELGTEELPAGEYVGMAEALCAGICDGLQSHSLSHGEAKVLATPRRLTVIVSDVAMNAACLLYTSPSPRDLSTSRMPSSA